MSAVGVQGHRQAIALQDGAQGRHHGRHAFTARGELGIQHVRGRIVHHGEQREPLPGHQAQPLMPAAVEMQQLAKTGARLAAPPVPAARPVWGDEPRALQRLVDEGIAEAHLVVPPGELVKVPDVEAGIALAVERQDPLHLGHGGPLGRRRPAPPIVELVDAVAFELPPQAAHAAGTAAQDLGGLDPGQLAGQRVQDHIANLHGALHRVPRISHGVPLGRHRCHGRELERSFHVANAATSRISYSPPARRLTPPERTHTVRFTTWIAP